MIFSLALLRLVEVPDSLHYSTASFPDSLHSSTASFQDFLHYSTASFPDSLSYGTALFPDSLHYSTAFFPGWLCSYYSRVANIQGGIYSRNMAATWDSETTPTLSLSAWLEKTVAGSNEAKNNSALVTSAHAPK